MEVLSKETIKPKSSTPHHLQKLNLSLLDQIAPPTYVHLLFFYYSPHLHRSQLSQNLKNSLSHVLTAFYPLAGRIIPHDSYIDCNDDGVDYAEFRVHACISDITQIDPEPAEVRADGATWIIRKPCTWRSNPSISSVMFMNAWATTCRHGFLQASIRPCFDLTCRFPPLDASTFSPKPQPPPSEDMGKIVTKRFVFDEEVLSKLKKVGASTEVKNPTRIEAVTAFLWRNIMIAFRQDDEIERKKINFAACHAGNCNVVETRERRRTRIICSSCRQVEKRNTGHRPR